jgi:iron uptake system component EfeO
VVDFESKLVGYAAAAFPKNMQEASDFKQKLLQRIVDDAAKMEKDFAPLALDNAAAFRGVIGSMEEQLEKVELAATSEEESRYARHTLSDMRANLEGGQKTFAAFRGWLDAVAADATLPGKIESGFAALAAKYQSLSGDAIPDVPADWNPDMPSASSLASPYGTLRTMLVDACDPKKAGSLVQLMGGAADALGIPQLPQ